MHSPLSPSPAPSRASSTDTDHSDVTALSAVDAVRLLRDGTLPVSEYWAALGRRSRAAAGFNALTTDFRPRRERPGILGGLPFLVKESFDVAGLPTSAGTRALIGHRPLRNAPAVQRLLDAGAAVAGKTVMHELSFGGRSTNPVHGYPRNPWDPSRICGGSSGGAAAAVALGIVPVGLGSDTGGSIRVPAALCGVFGFRPSVGRYPRGGYVPLSWTRDSIGPMARRIQDIALVDAVLTGRNPSTPSTPETIRLGISPGHLEDLEADVADAFSGAMARFTRSSAVDVVTVDIDDLVDRDHAISQTLVIGEFDRAIDRYLEGTGLDADTVLAMVESPDVARIVHAGRGAISARDHHEAGVERRRLQAELTARMASAGVQAMVFPTVPVTAPRIGDEDSIVLHGRQVPTFGTLMRHGAMGGTLGLPGLSMPAGLGPASGLPVGIEITAPPAHDDALLAMGHVLSDLLPAAPTPASPAMERRRG